MPKLLRSNFVQGKSAQTALHFEKQLRLFKKRDPDMQSHFVKLFVKAGQRVLLSTYIQTDRYTVFNIVLRMLRSELLNPKFGSQKSALL